MATSLIRFNPLENNFHHHLDWILIHRNNPIALPNYICVPQSTYVSSIPACSFMFYFPKLTSQSNLSAEIAESRALSFELLRLWNRSRQHPPPSTTNASSRPSTPSYRVCCTNTACLVALSHLHSIISPLQTMDGIHTTNTALMLGIKRRVYIFATTIKRMENDVCHQRSDTLFVFVLVCIYPLRKNKKNR